jgi:hypothetical protein
LIISERWAASICVIFVPGTTTPSRADVFLLLVV